MRIGSPKEVMPGEARVAMTPESAEQLQKLGHECFIESGAGTLARFSDTDYQTVGVTVVDSAKKLFDSVDVVVKVRPPLDVEVERMKKGQTLVGFLTLLVISHYSNSQERVKQMLSQWKWFRVSREPKRWTHCRRWPISQDTEQ